MMLWMFDLAISLFCAGAFVALILLHDLDCSHWGPSGSWLHQMVSKLVASLEAFLWVNRSLIWGRMQVCSIDHRLWGNWNFVVRPSRWGSCTRSREEMPLRRMNPRSVKLMTKDFRMRWGMRYETHWPVYRGIKNQRNSMKRRGKS